MNVSLDPRTAPQVALSSASETQYRVIFVYSISKYDRAVAKNVALDAEAAANVLPTCERRLLTNRNERSDESIERQRTRLARTVARKRCAGPLFRRRISEPCLACRAIGHDRARR
jgi:hypothetical protein